MTTNSDSRHGTTASGRVVGQAVPIDAAWGHVTGGAPFLDDLPATAGELYVGFAGSPMACGELIALDLAAARALPGIVACFGAQDLAGHNLFGPIFRDEPFLAAGELLYIGQPVAVLAAESRDALRAARRLVRIEAREREPILTIEQAIEAQRFIGPERRIARGDAAAALAGSSHTLEGTLTIGGQEHFYLESQAAIAYPGEEGQLRVLSSTQNPTETQAVVAELLGLSQHQVVCECRRMGGAFGGKETQGAIPAAMAALVAHKTGRPARIVYGKDEDMQSTGKRHAVRAEWRVGFDDDGVIQALAVHLFSNGGASADLSTSVMERCMLHCDNAYWLPNVEIVGRVCFTNLPPNTAFRGFGGPQAVATIENILDEIAQHRGLDQFTVRRRNLYGRGSNNTTPYGQLFDENQLPEILDQLERSSSYHARREAILEQQRKAPEDGPLELRGLGVVPVKFGISFTSRFLNQGNALVNIYTDGTVQVSTGGTEMGQGLSTKIRQLVAEELGLPLASVLVMSTSTEKNNNTSPTAASAGTDLNGSAAIQACATLRERLARFAADLLCDPEAGLTPSPEAVAFADGEVFDRRAPERRIPFSELAQRAHRERVDLGARGFYATPGVDFNRDTGRGTPFFYYTQGAAVAEVAIDRCTGKLRVLAADLLLDIGRSINPGVDLGQIYGGFIQGMGWVTAEQLVYSDRGALLSTSPTTYKVPGIRDVPPRFVAELFANDANRKNLYCSKAVGEPPLLVAVAVWTAVKDALARHSTTAARALRLPATHEEILRCLSLNTADVPAARAEGTAPAVVKRGAES